MVYLFLFNCCSFQNSRIFSLLFYNDSQFCESKKTGVLRAFPTMFAKFLENIGGRQMALPKGLTQWPDHTRIVNCVTSPAHVNSVLQIAKFLVQGLD